MKTQRLIKTLAIAVVGGVSACTPPAPYVHNVNEFNRESAAFRDGIASRSQVEICYNRDAASAQQILKLAEEECARFSKRAAFREQSIKVCPLVNPIAAVFDCLSPAKQ